MQIISCKKKTTHTWICLIHLPFSSSSLHFLIFFLIFQSLEIVTEIEEGVMIPIWKMIRVVDERN